MKKLSLLFFLFSSAYAFTLNNNIAARFEKASIPVYFAAGTCSNMNLSDSQMGDLIKDSFTHFWNKVPTSELELTNGGSIPFDASFQTGLLCSSNNPCVPNSALAIRSGIIIACNTNQGNFSNTTAVLGATVPVKIEGRYIRTAIFLINDDPNNRFKDFTYAEQRSVIAHEIGHAFGLGHSPDTAALMYYAHVTTRDALGWDDADGVTYLYPKKQPKVLSCGTISDGPYNGSSKFLSLLFGVILCIFLKKLIWRKI